jgi:recombination protein U
VCFDAKECATETFALQNVHEHQVEFMRDFEKQDGIAFFLIYFKSLDKYYYLRLCELEVFWERANLGGRKSFRTDELNGEYFFEGKNGFFVPYLELIRKDIDDRPE